MNRSRQELVRAGRGQGTGLSVLVTSTASDSHTWNLVFLQLVLEELGHRVTNLGACVPEDLLVAECIRQRPDIVVVSTVNGHGRSDGIRVIARLRREPRLADIPVVIGGKLGTSGNCIPGHFDELLSAGFDAVFDDTAGLEPFRSFVRALPAGAAC